MQVTLLSTSVVDQGFAVLAVLGRELRFGRVFVLGLANLWVQEC